MASTSQASSPQAHASLALRAAVRTTLVGCAELSALISGVYETAPAQTAMPYITLSDAQLTAWDSVSFKGHAHQLGINCWTDQQDMSRLGDIHALVRGVLEPAALSLAGHHLAHFGLLEERFLIDRAKRRRLGVLRYRALTHPL